MSNREESVYICRLCHAENKPTAKFCRRCGVARPPDAELVSDASPEPAPARAGKVRGNGAAAGGSAREVEDGEASSREHEIASAPVSEREQVVEEITEEEAEAELRRESSGGKAKAERAPGSPREAGPAEDSAGAGPGRPVKPGAPACITCGTGIRALDKFCIWCGEKQPDRPPPQMKRCSECRTQLPLTANFCFVCGNEVGAPQRRRVRVPRELFQEEDPELYPTFES